MGVERYWRYSQEKMSELIAEGRAVGTKPGTVPRYKPYLDEMSGVRLQNIWDDIKPVQSQSGERLGYPTQKPGALLERIIAVSSNPGDLVLAPFCGCGTALHAPQKLGRKWIGIDITHLGISLIESRLKSAFPGISFEVCGTPKDLEGARDWARRDKYQFQWWAYSMVEVPPYQGQKKGADSGIDGLRYISDLEGGREIKRKIIVSVKGGDNIGPAVVRELMGAVQNNKADMGWLVALADPTKPMIAEAAKAGFFRAGNGRDYPRLQILPVEDLISKRKRPEFFDMSLAWLAFKRAEKKRTLGEQQSLF